MNSLSYKLHQPQQLRPQNNQSHDQSVNSFTSLQTPGWSSIVKTQQSRDLNTTQKNKTGKSFQETVMEKLNRLKGVDLEGKQFSKISLKEHQTSSKYVICNVSTRETANQQAQPRTSTQRIQSVSKQPRTQPGTIYHPPESAYTSRNNNDSLNPPSFQRHQSVRRFNQISVHDHLYLDSRKQQNKRMMNKILDDQYQKTNVYTFTPTINPRNYVLAESKASRMKLKAEETLESRVTQKSAETKDEDNKENPKFNRYKLLNRVFYQLSGNQLIITQKQLDKRIEELPLPVIQTLQPILSKIYRGKEMSWVDFLDMFNSKKIANHETFHRLMERWFSRREPIQLQEKIPSQ